MRTTRVKVAAIIVGTLGLAVLAMAVAAVVQPAAPEDVPTDPRKWFGSTGVLAGVVLVIVQFIKPHLPVKGVMVKLLALAAGGLLGILGHVVSTVTGYPLTEFPNFLAAASFGLSAGVLAAGGKDVLGSMLTGGSSSSPTSGSGGTMPR